MTNRLLPFFTVCFFLFFACGEEVQTVDAIYFGGDIIPMTGEDDRLEAVAIYGGAIYAVGELTDLKKLQGSTTQMIDLAGKTLLPGFIDGHSHVMLGMEFVDFANVSSPPVADVTNINELIEVLETKKINDNILPGEWILGWGYDPDLLDEKRHPNKFDLDQAFPDNPVFLIHVSAHLATANSKALEIFGISADTPDPAGGHIHRVKGSTEPNGVLAETAVSIAREQLPKADSDNSIQKLSKTLDLYAANGITTANDGYTFSHYAEILEAAATKEKLPIDVISLIGFQDMNQYISDSTFIFNTYNNGLKFGGIKLVVDGSPQGKTAKMKDPYLTEVPGCAHDCRGISLVTQEQLNGLVGLVYSSDIQLFTHCNGDAAIDMFLEAHEKGLSQTATESKNLRSVIIHSQFMRPDLVEAYAHYGLIPSYFTNHTFFWGDVHMENMGEERAFFTSPLKSSIAADIVYTNHTDYPITPLDQLFVAWTAVNRISRNDVIIGQNEKTTAYEALKSLTVNAAFQYFEEDRKGTLEKGKLADFVILSDNPITVDPQAINTIKVEETIKEGTTVFKKAE